jgi:F-type H+-transporting ATPase subunit alpha
VPVEKVKQFETEFLEFMDLKYKDELKSLKSGILTGEIEKVLREAAAVVAEKFGSA